MATRVQGLRVGLGKAKQADITTASASFLRMRKLNADVTSPRPTFEDDRTEIGKGDEFISQVFGSHWDVNGSLEKYASSEFMTWALAYSLGNVSYASGTYTITPIDPGTTLELPYFTYVEQLDEGGGSAIDNAYVGCAVEDWMYEFNYGPGRANSKLNVNWVGSGRITTPSAVVLPAVQSESFMSAGSMSLSIIGVDYVTLKTILNGRIGWKNNLMLNAGFFPGSGTQNGLQVRGRIEIGARVPTFEFTARLTSGSSEYTKLLAQTTGTAVLTIQNSSSEQITITLQKLSFEAIENGNEDGIASVRVVGAPQKHATNGLISVSAKTAVTGIAG